MVRHGAEHRSASCSARSSTGSGSTTPVETDAFVCEYGESGYRASLPNPDVLAPRLGDWRPPQLYRYATDTGKLTDVDADLTGADHDRLDNTLGIRSAGSLGHTVLLAGPTLSGGIGQEATAINVFAFDAVSGEFIASTTIPAYSDIRRWITVKGDLYTAVGKAGGGGALLRWNGDPDHPGTAADPSPSLFDFEEVGSMPTEGADLAKLDGPHLRDQLADRRQGHGDRRPLPEPRGRRPRPAARPTLRCASSGPPTTTRPIRSPRGPTSAAPSSRSTARSSGERCMRRWCRRSCT